MTAGTETFPAPADKIDTTEETVRADSSPHTNPALSFEKTGPSTPEEAQRICFDDVHAYLAEQDEKARLAIIEEAHSGLKASIDTPYEDISPDDYNNIRLTSSLLLSNYWDLDTETARLPDNRETAFAAYLSIAKVYLSRAANSESWQDAAHLEETALPYLIAGLATQARPDQDAIDGLEKSLQNDDNGIQHKQAGHDSDFASSTDTSSKMHKEACKLIDLIIKNREFRKSIEEAIEKRRSETEAKKREEEEQKKRAKVGYMVRVLADWVGDTGRLPSPEVAKKEIFSNNKGFEDSGDFRSFLAVYSAYRERRNKGKSGPPSDKDIADYMDDVSVPRAQNSLIVVDHDELPPLPFAGSKKVPTGANHAAS